MRTVAAVGLLCAGVQAYDESCFSDCVPQPNGPAYPAGPLCPSAATATQIKGYVASTTATSSTDCPANCEPILSQADCDNAAKWLKLGMDGNAGPCPSGFVASPFMIPMMTPADLLGGCSYDVTAGQLKFNYGMMFMDPSLPPFSGNLNQASDTKLLICQCRNAMPAYVEVMFGKKCPNVDRDLADGVAQSCGPLTQEAQCSTAATTLGYADTSVTLDVSGGSLPDGCHYSAGSLQYNHALTGTVYASTDDKLICGCGEIAVNANYGQPYPRCGAVETVSKQCGVGQTCSPQGLNAFGCQCKYSPETATNQPAQCSEEIPRKYIQWITGQDCPWSADVQCITPPTKERCEEAAMQLGLDDVTASLPHSAPEKNSRTRGCHYVAGGTDHLFWNPSGTGQPASSNDYHICECLKYPIFVPRLSGGQCTSGAFPCKTVKSGFECGIAADLTGVPAPVGAALSTWNSVLCTPNPSAGNGSPWIPCGSGNDCTVPGLVVRVCEWTTGAAALVAAGTAQDSLDGCYYHADASYSGARLWFSGLGEGATNAMSTQSDFRLCDCAHEDEHDIIGPRLGFKKVGAGDCAMRPLDPMESCPAGKECTDENGWRTVRGTRYNCVGLTNAACHADSAVCTWTGTECVWAEASYAAQSEIPAHFSDCLEHCLLLYQCSAISFSPGNGGPGDVGGCDFFTDAISHTDTTQETAGSRTCWVNDPNGGVVPVAPVPNGVPVNIVQGSNPTDSPSSNCPVGFSVSEGSSTLERSAHASVALPGETNSTECRCEVFDNTSTPFTDVNHSYCGNVPESWQGAYHFTCPHCMETGTVINITCPNNWEACDLMINLYVCPGCSSAGGQAWHGLWPSSLATDGWMAAGKCAPAFCSTMGQHKFVGFHKQILGGDTEVLPEMETDPTMYFSIIVLEGRVCSSVTNQAECEQAPVCQWDSGLMADNCVQNWCPTVPGVGPNPGCGACAPGTPSGQCSA